MHAQERYLQDTLRYYSHWLDVDPTVFNQKRVISLYSEKRNQNVVGYGRILHLYCFLYKNLRVISFGDLYKEKINEITELFREYSHEAGWYEALEKILGAKVCRTRKFVFEKPQDPIDLSAVTPLSLEDYEAFYRFHKTLHPKADQEKWLKEYFAELAGRQNLFGIFSDEKLVCANDAPTVPYMADRIVEPGINTLPQYRQRGYAKQVCTALVSHLVRGGKTPIWSCSASNTASGNLALSIGFRDLGLVIQA